MARTVITIPVELSGRDELVTAEFQSALDEARAAEGALVIVPAGTYRIGSVRMYGDTELHLEEGAKVLGSDDIADYTDWDIPTTLRYATDPFICKIQGIPPHYTRALITVADVANVAITGEAGSEINGVDCTDPNGEEGFRGAMGIRVCRCKNVTLSGYTFADSANWSHQVDSCDNVLFEGVHVRAGHDGFNIHHCNNVAIRDCVLETGDDCVAGFDARNVLIEHTLLNTACNALRLGAANLLVRDCQFVGPGAYPHILEGTHHMHAAVKYYSIKGDVIREDACNWHIVNCSFENPGRLINYDYGSEKGYQTERPLVDLHFVGCTVNGAGAPSFFKGREDVPGELEFRDCSIEYVPAEKYAGTAFVELGAGAGLDREGVRYEGPADSAFFGPRVTEVGEKAEVLKRVGA